jgi:hypothetical protein
MKVNNDVYNGIISLLLQNGYETADAKSDTDKFADAIVKAIENLDYPSYSVRLEVHDRHRIYMDDINVLKSAGTPCLPDPQSLIDSQVDTTPQYIDRIKGNNAMNGQRFADSVDILQAVGGDRSGFLECSDHQVGVKPSAMMRFRADEIDNSTMTGYIGLTHKNYERLINGANIVFANTMQEIIQPNKGAYMASNNDGTSATSLALFPSLLDLANEHFSTSVSDLQAFARQHIKSLLIMDGKSREEMVKQIERNIETVLDGDSSTSDDDQSISLGKEITIPWAATMIDLVSSEFEAIEDVDTAAIQARIEFGTSVLERIRPNAKCDLPNTNPEVVQASLRQWLISRPNKGNGQFTVQTGFLSLSDIILESTEDNPNNQYSHLRTIQPSSVCLTQHAREMVIEDMARLVLDSDAREALNIEDIMSRLEVWKAIDGSDATVSQLLYEQKHLNEDRATAVADDTDDDDSQRPDTTPDEGNMISNAEDFNDFDLDLELAIEDIREYSEMRKDEEGAHITNVNSDVKLQLLRHLAGCLGIRPGLSLYEQSMLMGYLSLLVPGKEESQLNSKIEEVRSRYKEFIAKYGKDYNESLVISKLQSQYSVFISIENAVYMMLLLHSFIKLYPERLKTASVKPCKKHAQDLTQCVIENGLLTFLDEDMHVHVTKESISRWLAIASVDISKFPEEDIKFDGAATYSSEVVLKSISLDPQHITGALSKMFEFVNDNAVIMDTRSASKSRNKKWFVPSCCLVDAASLVSDLVPWHALTNKHGSIEVSAPDSSDRVDYFVGEIFMNGDIITSMISADDDEEESVISDDETDVYEIMKNRTTDPILDKVFPLATASLVEKLGVEASDVPDDVLNDIGYRFLQSTLVPTHTFYRDAMPIFNKHGLAFDLCIFAIFHQSSETQVAESTTQLNSLIHMLYKYMQGPSS